MNADSEKITFNDANNPMLHCTPQIYLQNKNNEKDVHPSGSGVFFKDNENYFLITAKHILNEVDRYHICVFINSQLVKLSGNWKYFISANQYDNVDIAILRIEHQLVNLILFQYKFIIKETLSIDIKASNENLFILTGFPTKQTIKKGNVFHVEPLSFITQEIVLKRINKIHLNDKENIVVKYRRKDQGFLNDDFKAHGPADLRGISGCGLWVFDSKIGITNPVNLKLAGIVIEADINRGIICATRIYLAYLLIINGFY